MAETAELIKKCLSKDSRAEYALYKKYFNTLMRICWRYTKNEDDASALLNQGFLKVLNSLENYNSQLSFETWIKTIMVNTIIDEFRTNAKRNSLFISHDMEEIRQSFHPVDINIAEQKLSIEEIVREIKKLPEQHMLVFNLFVFDGLSHKEIADYLRIPEGICV